MSKDEDFETERNKEIDDMADDAINDGISRTWDDPS